MAFDIIQAAGRIVPFSNAVCVGLKLHHSKRKTIRILNIRSEAMCGNAHSPVNTQQHGRHCISYGHPICVLIQNRWIVTWDTLALMHIRHNIFLKAGYITSPYALTILDFNWKEQASSWHPSVCIFQRKAVSMLWLHKANRQTPMKSVKVYPFSRHNACE